MGVKGDLLIGIVPRNFLGGVGPNLWGKMGVAPMTEEYLFTRKVFMNKCNKLKVSITPQHLILLLGFLEYEKVKILPIKMANLVIYRENPCLGGVTPLHPL